MRVKVAPFTMGSPENEPGRDDDEVQHPVTLTRDFWLAAHEVTQGQWAAVMGGNPAQDCKWEHRGPFVDERFPVNCVSWLDAVAFANRLSEREGLTPAYTVRGDEVSWDRSANGYRLPTEAEWEYAARAGTTTPWGGPTSREGDLCALGNVADQTAKAQEAGWTVAACNDGVYGLARVGAYAPNPWGLYDMVSNVWEWTWDPYADYPSAATDPPASDQGALRVIRGGCWNVTPADARVANRSGGEPGIRYADLGFRLARSVP